MLTGLLTPHHSGKPGDSMVASTHASNGRRSGRHPSTRVSWTFFAERRRRWRGVGGGARLAVRRRPEVAVCKGGSGSQGEIERVPGWVGECAELLPVGPQHGCA